MMERYLNLTGRVAEPLAQWWSALRPSCDGSPVPCRGGYQVEEASSWSQLLDAQLVCGELAGVFLGEYGPADEEAEIVRRFRERDGAAGVPLILVGGMNALLRTSKFRSAGVDLVVPADTSPELLMEKVAPLFHYGALYRSLRDSNRSLREQAMLDDLTGLPNRRRFSLDAARNVEMARRIGRPLSCIITDIDDFKKVNEQFGQEAGDSVIRQLGAMLNRARRAYDSVARLGGDEFAWLLVDADPWQAVHAAESVQYAVRENLFDLPAGPVRLTATFGVSTVLPGVDLTVEHLVCNADRALYSGKESGKNVVRFYPVKKANFCCDRYLPILPFLPEGRPGHTGGRRIRELVRDMFETILPPASDWPRRRWEWGNGSSSTSPVSREHRSLALVNPEIVDRKSPAEGRKAPEHPRRRGGCPAR